MHDHLNSEDSSAWYKTVNELRKAAFERAVRRFLRDMNIVHVDTHVAVAPPSQRPWLSKLGGGSSSSRASSEGADRMPVSATSQPAETTGNLENGEEAVELLQSGEQKASKE